MDLLDYQRKAMRTCMPSSENFSYMFINLVGEVGEFASKVAKSIRKGNSDITGNHLYTDDDKELNDLLRKEAGDILWQLSSLCAVMNWNLDDIAKENLEKLSIRAERGVIDGNGDNR